MLTQIGEGVHEQVQPSSILSQLTLERGFSWFAVQTKPNHEKRAAAELEEKGVIVFLPVHAVVRQWSDRKRVIELPLFTNYLFVRIRGDRGERVKVLSTNAVVRFVGKQGGVSIPDEEIQSIGALLRSGVAFEQCSFGTVGQTVQIRGGSLDGIQGTVVGVNGDRSLVVSVKCIQRSLTIRLHGYRVEPVLETDHACQCNPGFGLGRGD